MCSGWCFESTGYAGIIPCLGKHRWTLLRSALRAKDLGQQHLISVQPPCIRPAEEQDLPGSSKHFKWVEVDCSVQYAFGHSSCEMIAGVSNLPGGLTNVREVLEAQPPRVPELIEAHKRADDMDASPWPAFSCKRRENFSEPNSISDEHNARLRWCFQDPYS